MRRTKASSSLLHGSLEALILKTLSHGGRHGYGIARWIEATTEEVVQVEEGSMYPALARMERRGWVRAEWGLSEKGRRAKFYHLTDRGREQLERQTEEWSKFSSAVSRILLP